MTFPANTTLNQIITLAHQQYGIRFQLNTNQLVSFANMVQMIAYNQDLACFQEWNQKLYLAQDVFLNVASYTVPVETDIGLVVSGSTTGAFGHLRNFRTTNRLNQWVIEPMDGAGNFTLVAGETVTIVAGSVATGVVSQGQTYKVSNGPYRAPRESTGNPSFRKFLGITKVTDRQIFGVPSSDAVDNLSGDYGIDLNYYPGRKANIPYRWDEIRKEIILVTNDTLAIEQSAIGAISPATVNDSPYRWIYYINPPTIVSINDEDKVILPEEYRYEILYKGIERLSDTATYGDRGDARALIEPLCKRFWEDKGVQFQAFGKANDWISHGDVWNSGAGFRRHYSNQYPSGYW